MSLTGWFREYLYIPLGGNRKGKGRQVLNNMIVFLCTGIWHGANLTFLVWGAFHGVLISIETLLYKKDRPAKKIFLPIKWLYTIFAVIIGFVIFRADSIAYGWDYVVTMFSFSVSESGRMALMSIVTPSFIVTLIMAILASCPWLKFIKNKTQGTEAYTILSCVGYAVTFVLLFMCVLTLAADSYNPFIYFRF